NAKQTLKGMWGTAAIGTLVYMLIVGVIGCIPIFGQIAVLVIGGPMALGYISFIIALKSDKENARIERLFDGFKDFVRLLIANLLMVLYIFLWSLLFVIPGLIMIYAYSMTFYILAEDKEISASDAIRKSKQMMMGNKWKLFCLQIRFFGWVLLCGLTFGILLFWIKPYLDMAVLNFYYDIKGEAPVCAKTEPAPQPKPEPEVVVEIKEEVIEEITPEGDIEVTETIEIDIIEPEKE
ncbi:DUF975 family protein, partial [Bacteroidales bacterium OttesenSCG-928-K03]|nr:DUF975 family protein [Bacteroidales bacterium OttesenSCG-928-K03]